MNNKTKKLYLLQHGECKREAGRQKAKQRLGKTTEAAEEMPIKNEKCQDYFQTK